jgi:lipopolysaccharide transport system ATP-binding protein
VIGPALLVAQGQSLDHDVVVRAPAGDVPVLMCGWVRADGTAVYGTSSEMDGVAGQALGGGRFRFRLRFDALPLLPGSYLLRTHVLDAEGLRLFCTSERAVTVTGATRELGIARLPHRWLGPDDAP